MRLLIALCAVLGVSSLAAAQPPPPIQGVTGTIATDGTIKSEHKAAQKVVEGVKKILPGGNSTTENPLDALIEGSHVVVRDVADSGDALKTTTQGVVIEVNRSRKQITIRSTDKTTHTLRVMDASAASTAGAHVVVSLEDQADAKTYDFKRVS
jgi:glutamine amidotransferase PdxT